MNERWSGAGAAVLKGSVELLLYLPLLLAAAAFLLPGDAPVGLWLATLPLCYGAGYAGCLFLKAGRRFPLLLLSAGIGAVYSLLIFGGGYALWVGLPLAAVAVYRGARLVIAAWQSLFPVTLYAIGLLFYFAASIAAGFPNALQPYLSLLLWGGLAALAVTLLMTNQANVRQETLSGDKNPVLAAAVVWQNRLLVLGLFLVIVAVATFRIIQAAVRSLKDWLLAWLRELLALAHQPEQAPQTDNRPPGPPPLGGTEEPSAWLLWLEKAAMVVAGIAGAAIAVVVLYLLLVRLLRLSRWLYHRLTKAFDRNVHDIDDPGYEDNVETLLDWKELTGELASRIRGWGGVKAGAQPKWEELKDNREKIRYLYRTFLLHSFRDGYKLKRHLTPKETAADLRQWKPGRIESSTLIELYERARYGVEPIRDEEVDSLVRSSNGGKPGKP